MREIKFRAWDKTNKLMLEVLWFDLRPGKQVKMQTFGKPQEQWSNFSDMVELMQFTGLLDKNGKEIYEGDIVHYFVMTAVGKRFEYTEEVKWDEKLGGFANSYYISIGEDREVIGNIYENPELISNQ